MTLTLPAGTTVSVARVDDPARRWRAHRTRRRLAFVGEYRTPQVRGSSGAVVFREGEWLILTRWNRIKKERSET